MAVFKLMSVLVQALLITRSNGITNIENNFIQYLSALSRLLPVLYRKLYHIHIFGILYILYCHLFKLTFVFIMKKILSCF